MVRILPVYCKLLANLTDWENQGDNRMITKPKKKETKTYLALIVIGIALVLGCPPNGGSSGPVTKSVPAGGAEYPLNGPIVLTYSGTVVKGTGNITIKLGTAAAVTVPAGDVVTTPNPTATPVTTTVTITPSATIAADDKVTITIPAGVFKIGTADVAAYTLSYTATAADNTAPTLASSVPAVTPPATGVAVDANIVLTFNEVVVKGTGNISIKISAEGTSNNLPATAVTVNGAVVTINPEEDLVAAQPHVITIPAGAFEDSFGNANAEIVIAFTTQ